MRNSTLRRVLSVLLIVALSVSMAFAMTACKSTPKTDGDKTDPSTQASTEAPTADTLKFTFKVVDAEGKETSKEIETTEKTVGAALLKEKLIEGEDGDYGLYIKTVYFDGTPITADYDTDKAYWAFYIGDEYASKGADMTDIEDGATYTFKIEKGN